MVYPRHRAPMLFTPIIRGKRHSKRDRLWAISRDLCASICCAPVCAQRARSREWARLRKNSCAARAPWIAGPTNHGVARCMDSILERMRGKQSKCLASGGAHFSMCTFDRAGCKDGSVLAAGGAAIRGSSGRSSEYCDRVPDRNSCHHSSYDDAAASLVVLGELGYR